MASPKCSTDGCVYLPPELCSTPLLSPIHPNSTLSQVVSPCLAKTALPAFPVLVSFLAVCWLSLQPALFPGSCQSSQQLPFTKLAISKLILSLLAVLFGIMDFTLTLALPSFLGPSPTLPEQYNEPLFGLAFSLSALLAYGQCIRLGFVTSGLLHLAWVFRLLSLLLDLALALLDSPHPFLAVPSNFLLLLHLLVALGISGLLCAADTLSGPQQYEQLDAHGKQVCPNKRVSAISSAIYWYVSGLVWHGLRGSLSFDHIWAMNKEDQAEFLRERFYGTAKQRKQAESEPKKPMTLFSLFWHIFRSIWEPTCTAIALAILIVLGRYANAAFLRLIVDSVNSQKPLWLTLTTLVGLFAVDLVSKVITTRRDLHSQRAFQNSRASITTAIFDKMLKLSAAGRAKYSAGEVLNLLTTDVLRVRYFFWLLRDFVYCPFMIMIALFGLFMEIGWNTMFGVGILISVLPINYWLSKVQSRLEEKQMKIKDARLKLVNDALSGMKVLKLYAWEESMQRRIFEQRRREMYALRKIFLLDAAISLSFQLAPLLATIVSFYGYTILQGNPMRPDVAFVSLLFFAMLRFSIYQLPQLLTYTIRARVSGKRILDLLNEQEQQPSHIVRDFDPSNIDHSPVVLLRNCSFSWSAISGQANPTLHLRNINLTMPAGELIGIVGRVGSGKSSMLAAILGEMSRLDGEEGSEALVRARTIGYVPQQPWIQNRTLRSNVLFDLPMDENRYAAVLSACALETDMKLLAAGDLTEIGEKGINLSGGQKSRVALARAVYQDADLYVLDDTLSAVDAHVGAHIFDKVISQNGLLAKKTRLWALNTLAFLRHCDRLVVMDGGEINSIGTLEELKQQKEGPFADLIREFMQKQLERQRSARSGGVIEGDGVGSIPADNELAEVLDQLQLTGSPLSNSLLEQRQKFEQQQSASEAETVPSPSSPPNPSPAVQNGTATASTTILRCRRRSHSQCSHDHGSGAILSEQSTTTVFHSQLQLQQAPAGGDTANELIGRLTDEEELATGMVSRRVYLDYMRAFGLWLSFFFFFFLFMGNSAAEGLSSVWLAQWSNQNSTAKSTFYLSIYGAFNMASVVCTAITGIIIALGAYYASTAFHDRLLRSLFRSPMAFYERTPLGRILNRLSNDIDRIDENIPWAVSSAMIIFAEALNSLIAICIVIPSLMLVVFPLLAIFLVIVHLYNLASVQLRRLSSKSWSSTCSFVQDAHLGSDSIRVFNVQEPFRDRCCRLTDFTNETSSAEIYTNRWLQVRLDIISDVAVFICVLVAVLMAYNGYVTLGTLAMVIGSGYTFTGYLGEVARVWRESEVQMVCIERVGEYIRNEHEPAWRLPRLCGPNWPSAGQIQFVDFCLRYRPDLELVLKNLSFEVKPGEKVGIVGRTGAGKSSLTLALFRILEPASGKILIDGVDIGTLGLHDLRSALTIIPQDPVLFCGTLRTNLDPFDEYTDSGIWDALEKAHLKETVSGWEDGLAHEVAEGGSNLSVGQRQLVCLARALLRQRTRILVLDEATASIDADTDARIQESIRKHFKHCTLLTIAHRLNTILDYDRILVMDAGQVAEFDSPSALLTRPQSLFFQLAKQAGVGLNRE